MIRSAESQSESSSAHPRASRLIAQRDARVEVIDLGRIAYADAYQKQTAFRDELIEARRAGVDPPPPMRLLLLEHDPPVITVSRRTDARQHLIAPPKQLEHLGIEIAETDRGGDITYHGPGQLVAYAILDLKRLRLGVHDYMRWLEAIVIDTLDVFGIAGARDESATGVWAPIDPSNNASAAGPFHSAKICAMGVRVSRWVTMHGLALNVSTDLSHFQTIVPCGLAGRPVTSMANLLGEDRTPAMEAVKRAMRDQFIRRIHARLDGEADHQ